VLEAQPEIDSGRRHWRRGEDILHNVIPACVCRLFRPIHVKQIVRSLIPSRIRLTRPIPKDRLRLRPMSLLLRRVACYLSGGKMAPLRWVHAGRRMESHYNLSIAAVNLTPCRLLLATTLGDLTLVFPEPLACFRLLRLLALPSLARGWVTLTSHPASIPEVHIKEPDFHSDRRYSMIPKDHFQSASRLPDPNPEYGTPSF